MKFSDLLMIFGCLFLLISLFQAESPTANSLFSFACGAVLVAISTILARVEKQNGPSDYDTRP